MNRPNLKKWTLNTNTTLFRCVNKIPTSLSCQQPLKTDNSLHIWAHGLLNWLTILVAALSQVQNMDTVLCATTLKNSIGSGWSFQCF